jgi:hypothetical protein
MGNKQEREGRKRENSVESNNGIMKNGTKSGTRKETNNK